MKAGFKSNFLIAFISALLSLLLAEAGLRMLVPCREFKVGDLSSPKSVIYGWAPLPNNRRIFKNPDTGEKIYFDTNSQGWRDIEHDFVKTGDVFRILFLGDSNTWGYVPLDELYTRQTEFLLNKKGFNTEVINMAVGGWGTDQLLEALQVEGIKYSPDIVIYQFYENDIANNLMPFETTSSSGISWNKAFKYEIDGENLKRVIMNRPSVKRPIKDFLLKSALLYNLNKVKNKSIDLMTKVTNSGKRGAIDPFFTTYRDMPGGNIDKGWELFERLIIEMDLVCRQNNAKFIVFAQSGEKGEKDWNIRWNGLKTEAGRDFAIWEGKKYPVNLNLPLKRLRDICRGNNIDIIEPKREYHRYEYDAHPNKAGNVNMAYDIIDFLINERFLREEDNEGV